MTKMTAGHLEAVRTAQRKAMAQFNVFNGYRKQSMMQAGRDTLIGRMLRDDHLADADRWSSLAKPFDDEAARLSEVATHIAAQIRENDDAGQ